MGVRFSATGSGSWIDFNRGGALDNAEPFTVSFWMNLTSAGPFSQGNIVAKGGQGNGTGVWSLRFNSNSTDLNFQKDFATADYSVVWAGVVSLGTNFHIVLTWDGLGTGTGTFLYVNGVSSTLTSMTTGVGAKNVDGTKDFGIGNRNSGLGNRPIAGIITELAFWNSAILTQDQIKILANSRVKYAPLQITPPTGSLALYVPFYEIPEGVSMTTADVIKSIAPVVRFGSANMVASGTLPTGAAESIVSYA